jgi:hypothetical protein
MKKINISIHSIIIRESNICTLPDPGFEVDAKPPLLLLILKMIFLAQMEQPGAS